MDRFMTTAAAVLGLTAVLIFFLGLTAGLALVSSVGLAYLFIGMIRGLQNGGLLWSVIDVVISLSLGFLGTFIAGLTIGGSSGLLSGLLVSIYLSTCIKGKITPKELFAVRVKE